MDSAKGHVSQQRPKIADVAQLAGVSVGTVSNVLNRPDRVAERTRSRVQGAIDELGFVRNGSARQLREGVTHTVGAVVLDITNPFFTAVARGIEDRLAEDAHALMLASSDEDPERERRLLLQFEEHGVRGLLITPAHGDLESVERLRDRGVPVVLLDHTSPRTDISSVSVDDVRGAAMAMSHLLSLGHERIAFLNGSLAIRQCADRRDGVLQALEDAGLDPEETLVEAELSSLDADSGAAAVGTLLEDHPEVTALFCVNDVTALGALQALRSQGVEVPGAMALVGYDDVPFAAQLAPSLTSVRQPAREIGRRAADLLLGQGPPQQIVFRPELVVRASSAAPAGPG